MGNYGFRIVNKKNKVEGLLELVEAESLIIHGQITHNPFFGKNIYDLFPFTVQIGKCGCKKEYKELSDFPDGDDKCKHKNYFILYENNV